MRNEPTTTTASANAPADYATATTGRAPRRGPRLKTMLFVLLGLGVLARLIRYLLNFPLWGDEAFVAVDFLGRDYRDLLAPLTYHQFVPLVFMWVELWMTRTFGLAEYVVRFVPVAAGVVSLFIFWRFLARIVDRRTALIAVGFLAAAYYPIRHATEVKPYSTDLFFSLVLLWLTWDVVCERRSFGRWATLIIVAPAIIWWSFPSVFVIAAAGCVLAVLATFGNRTGGQSLDSVEQPQTAVSPSSRRTSVAAWTGVVIFAIATAASFFAMYKLYAQPHAQAAPKITEAWGEEFPPLESLGDALSPPADRPELTIARRTILLLKSIPFLIYWFIKQHTGNLVAYPVGGSGFGSIVTTALVVIGSIRLWKTNRLLLLLLLGPLPFNLAAAALQKYPYGGTVRISIFMAPAFCTLAALGVITLFRRFVKPRDRRTAVQIAAGVLALIAFASIALDVLIPYKKEANAESRRVVREFAAEVAPTDQVVVLNSLDPTTYLPYIAPWKGDGAQFIYYLSDYLEPKLRAADPHLPKQMHPLDRSRGKIEWAPPAAAIPPAATGATTWLIFFHGGNFLNEKLKAYDPQQIADYVAQIAQTRGTPEQSTNVLQRKKMRDGSEPVWQVIDIYRFPPNSQ